MNQQQIRRFLEEHESKKTRTIVIVDFGNVDKWSESLDWKISVAKLANLTKSLSTGSRFLRRFYYGADYGPREKSETLVEWSRSILQQAEAHGFEVIAKRVKYIHSVNNISGYEKKCDLDVEMTVDLIRERNNYDTIVLFSGDGDLAYAVNYLCDSYGKKCIVFGARDHVGREIFDAKARGSVSEILFAQDFEYRLNLHRNS